MRRAIDVYDPRAEVFADILEELRRPRVTVTQIEDDIIDAEFVEISRLALPTVDFWQTYRQRKAGEAYAKSATTESTFHTTC